MDAIAPSGAPIPYQLPGPSLRAGLGVLQLDGWNQLFPMRQQQTGMY